MTMVTMADVANSGSLVGSTTITHGGLPVAGTSNPARTEAFNTPRDIYPKHLDNGNYYVTIDKQYPDLRCVYYRDGTFLGHTTAGNKGETEWPRMIAKHQAELTATAVSDITKSEYEKQDKERKAEANNL